MTTTLQTILEQCSADASKGALANYIPELAKADPTKCGIYVVHPDGQRDFAGDHDHPFTMQSVVKPLILLMALIDSGMDKVRDLVGVEATGKPFDSFNYSDLALRREHINPMINTGAIALCTLIRGETYEEKFSRLLALCRFMAGNPAMEVDEAVYQSEKLTGNKNRALAYMLRAYGLIDDHVDDILDCYFRACSIKATCQDLANIAFIFANHGRDAATGMQLFDPSYATYVNAVLMICGMYDGSGEFALNVGFPAKSGVGGGIMGVVPGKMGIGVYSPCLDSKGNSVVGVRMLEELSREQGLSIF